MTDQTNSQVPLLPEPRRPIPPAPVHPLAALATVVLDNVFGVFEIVDPFALILTAVSVGVVGTVTTMFVQRYLAKDSWGASIAKGLVMGIIAGVPFQVTGTLIGVPLLAWAGLHELIKLPAPKAKPNLPPAAGDEIVDGEIREVK
jgi:hypothetical protein